MTEFHALGGLTVTENGDEVSIGGPRQRRLVAMLLIHRDSVVSVDRLTDAVFAGEPTPGASTTLRSYVTRIRKVIDGASGARVVTQAPGYLLTLPGDGFDVARFERLLADAGAELGRDDPAEAAKSAREALRLWRGDAYAEFAAEDWARPEAQRLEEMRLVAHERLVEAELACGGGAELIPSIEGLVADHPLRETFRAQLMVALYRAGRHADALRVLDAYRRVLLDELGLDPSPALAELEHRVLTHDPSLVLAEPAGRPLRGYRLGERLGTGPAGTVFAARVPGVEREFAIRVYRQEVADCPGFVRSFEASAHRVASLRHPAIIPIHDYWREPGAAYLVLRRMHGGTLAERLERGPVASAAMATLVGRIGGALTAAAELGIVHGRVVPQSVFFDERGDAFLSDFALDETDDSRCPADDVRDLAVMVGSCLASTGGEVAEALARGVATHARPAMAEFVPMLVGALSGAPPSAGGTRPNPYKGLRAFDEADAVDFFGRDDALDAIVTRLARVDLRGRLVLVVGGSGTGKSSLVRAGLLPRVRRGDVPGSQRWFVATMLPGSAPFKELAESLRHVAVTDTTGLVEELARGEQGIDRVLRRVVPDGGQLLLVVDQFEELFTLASEGEQRAFLEGVMHALTVAGSRLRVVATLRADFYDRPLSVHHFGAAVNEATVTVPAMAPADLEAAVVEPVERVGGRVDRALVAELVSAVVDEPAALPSLQFALYELAERSPDKHLTLSGYRALGGVSGAIASRAEALYQALDDTERAAVRRMFERLVVVGAEGEPTRRRTPHTELSGLGDRSSMDAVIDRWAQARLLTLDRHPQSRLPTVELAHEALLRAWPRVRRWIEEDREAIVVLGGVRDSAASWEELDRDPGALYRGARLQVALDVAAGRHDDLPSLEREFLDASGAERDREQRDAAERLERQAKANRRLRMQLAAIAAALVVALVVGFIAFDQRRDAQRQGRVAVARELAAAADANVAVDPERSMLLALAAIDETRRHGGAVLPEAEEALHRAVSASRVERTFSGVGGALDWSPTGTMFVTEGPEDSGLIDIRDAVTGASVRSFHGHDPDVNDVAFSPDGALLASAGDDGAVRIWDVSTGAKVSEFVGPTNGTARLSFAPDGSRVAAMWADTLRVLDSTTGDVLVEVEAREGPTSFSPDGQRIALASSAFDGPTLSVFDAASGATVFVRADPADLDFGTNALAWSPDGRWIATARGDATVVIWGAATGEKRFTMAGHTAVVNGVDWSSDGTQLASVAADGRAIVSEVTDTGLRQVLSLSAHSTAAGLFDVAFSPDDQRLMTSTQSIENVTVWDVAGTGGGEWPNVQATRYVPTNLRAADFTPDGTAVAVGQPDGSVLLTDVETGEHITTIGPRRAGATQVGWVDVSGDGQLIAAAAFDEPVNVWNASTGELRFEVPVVGPDSEGFVWAMQWSPDGERLAVGTEIDGQTEVVITDRSGTQLATLRDEGFVMQSMSFSADGRLLATADLPVGRFDPSATQVTIWDWERGEVVDAIDTIAALAEFDPTGTRLAIVDLLEGSVSLRGAEDGELLTRLATPAPTMDVAFSPDGALVATAHTDGTTRLWDAQTGAPQRVLGGGGGQVDHVAFSPDGSKLLTAGDDGLVHVWALDLDDLIRIAESRLTRSFTDNECRQYLHVDRCPPN